MFMLASSYKQKTRETNEGFKTVDIRDRIIRVTGNENRLMSRLRRNGPEKSDVPVTFACLRGTTLSKCVRWWLTRRMIRGWREDVYAKWSSEKVRETAQRWKIVLVYMYEVVRRPFDETYEDAHGTCVRVASNCSQTAVIWWRIPGRIPAKSRFLATFVTSRLHRRAILKRVSERGKKSIWCDIRARWDFDGEQEDAAQQWKTVYV